MEMAGRWSAPQGEGTARQNEDFARGSIVRGFPPFPSGMVVSFGIQY